MREAGIAAALVGTLALVSAAALMPFESALALAGVVVGIGALVGVPSGVWYHVLLYRALAPARALPRGWIWSPIQYNDRVPEPARGPVLFYCYVGAVGFVIMVLGLLAVLTSVVFAFLRAR